ncbi:MAG: hypothetical protein H3Z52_12420 [archaeon]|nr:hypothetical protein [archaeon]MCP8315285.1 hypothetical protein [archaeon]MCP8321724.1 hypothetical protein [archaeon]
MGQKGVLSAIEDLYNQPNVIHIKPKGFGKMTKGFCTRTVFRLYDFVSIVKNKGRGRPFGC